MKLKSRKCICVNRCVNRCEKTVNFVGKLSQQTRNSADTETSLEVVNTLHNQVDGMQLTFLDKRHLAKRISRSEYTVILLVMVLQIAIGIV